MSELGMISTGSSLGLLADRFDPARAMTGAATGTAIGTVSGDEHRAFEDVLGVARDYDANESNSDREARAREGAEKLIASVFVEPLLKSVRESSQAAEPFKLTSGEKQFRSLLDARVAETVVRKADLSLTKRIAADLLGAGSTRKIGAGS